MTVFVMCQPCYVSNQSSKFVFLLTCQTSPLIEEQYIHELPIKPPCILHRTTGVVLKDPTVSSTEAQEEAACPCGINKPPPGGVDPDIWLINLYILSACTCLLQFNRMKRCILGRPEDTCQPSYGHIIPPHHQA
jgi:hypothetical protein